MPLVRAQLPLVLLVLRSSQSVTAGAAAACAEGDVEAEHVCALQTRDNVKSRKDIIDMPVWLLDPSRCESADVIFQDARPHSAWKGHSSGEHNRILDTCRTGVAQKLWDAKAEHSSPHYITRQLTKGGLNTSLMISGDSTSNQHFRVVACMLEEVGFALSAQERLVQEGNSCFLWTREKQQFELCRMYSAKFPKIPIKSVASMKFRENAILLVEVSSHYNNVTQYHNELQAFVSGLAKLEKGVQAVVRSPLPQHFDGATGAYDPLAKASHIECTANTEKDPKYNIFKHILSGTEVRAWDVYPVSESAVSAHPDPSIKRDCTHFCNAVVYTWSELLAEIVNTS